jgi:hypothetical protein
MATDRHNGIERKSGLVTGQGVEMRGNIRCNIHDKYNAVKLIVRRLFA